MYSYVASPDEGCTFHVTLDLVALYKAGIITDDDYEQQNSIVVTYNATLADDATAGTYKNKTWVSWDKVIFAREDPEDSVPEDPKAETGESEEDEEYTITNVEVGSSLTIKESDAQGYTPVVTIGSDTTALPLNADGSYTVKEVTPGMVITFTNVKYMIQLTKVDKDTDKPLSGAKFQLKMERADGTWELVDSEKQTNENGIAEWIVLKPGRYCLTETQAPEGYLKNSSERVITLPDEAEDGIVKVTFENFKAPETGSSGTIFYTAAGLSILACAAGVFIVSRRKQRG